MKHNFKSKFFIFVIVVLTIILLILLKKFIGFVIFSQEGCVMPIDNLMLTSNTVLCAGLHNIDDSDGDGAIIINSNDIILDCNNSIINGTNAGNSIAIHTNWKNNLIIKNCQFNNFYRFIYVTENSDYTEIVNNTFGNTSNVNILSYSDNLKIKNNQFTQSNNLLVYSTSNNGIFSDNSINLSNKIYSTLISLENQASEWSIKNNYLENSIFYFNIAPSIVIQNNTFINIENNAFAALTLKNSINSEISQNTFNDGKIRTYVYNSSFNMFDNIYHNDTWLSSIDIFYSNFFNISFNNISNIDSGITIKNSTDFRVFRNYINFTIIDIDGWLSGIRLEHDIFNFSIEGNVIENYIMTGLLLRNVKNGQIINNDFKEIPDDFLLSSNEAAIITGQTFQIPSAIKIVEYYKGYLDGCGSTPFECKNYNVTVYNNNYDSNVKTYVHSQGLYDSNINIPDYWYKKFSIPNYSDEIELYSSINYETIDRIRVNQKFDDYYFGSDSSINKVVIANFSKKNYMYKNVDSNTNFDILLFNLSLSYPYNDIYDVNSGTVLASNQIEYNITLAPGQQIIVGNFTSKSGPPTTSTTTTTTTTSTTTTANVTTTTLVNSSNSTTTTSATTTTTAAPEESSSSSSGGGGGGSSSAPDTESPAKVVSASDKKLEEITITKIQMALDAQVVVQVKEPENKIDIPIFQYMEITHDADPSKVNEVKFQFYVPLNKIVYIDQVALYRYTTKWDKLPTEYLSKDETNAYFEAVSPGLSFFVIAEEPKIIVTTTTTTTTTIATTTTTEEKKQNIIGKAFNVKATIPKISAWWLLILLLPGLFFVKIPKPSIQMQITMHKLKGIPHLHILNKLKDQGFSVDHIKHHMHANHRLHSYIELHRHDPRLYDTLLKQGWERRVINKVHRVFKRKGY
jgi:PGF-pre-PGF domain-containing protein